MRIAKIKKQMKTTVVNVMLEVQTGTNAMEIFVEGSAKAR